MPLRDYQDEAINKVSLAFQAGTRRALLVSPTGSGKTVMFCDLINRCVQNGNKVIVLVHRKELLDQAAAKLADYGVSFGIIAGSDPRYRPWLPVQVASVQTLARREIPACNLLVIDEAHHARAATYGRVIEACPDAVVLGVTATPWRTDNKGLGDLFEHVIVAATTADLVIRGYLVPVTGFAFDTPDLSGVRRTGGDYNEKDLGILMGGSKLMGNIVDTWCSRGGGVRTVLFAVNIEHSRNLVAGFRSRGVAAEHLDGTTPKAEREAILARLDSGTTTVVSNVGVLTEGWDSPRVECCILARPTLSTGLYIQMVGRIRRPSTGKEKAVVFDHAGCVLKHGLPDQWRDYSLTESEKKAKGPQATLPVRCCEKCFALYDPALDGCPVCGFTNPRKLRGAIEEVDGVAVSFEELERQYTVADPGVMERDYLRWVELAAAKKYKPGWASYQFKAKYGQWPRKEWRRASA